MPDNTPVQIAIYQVVARERPKAPSGRELSPQATEGEKMLQFIPYITDLQNLQPFLSPSQLR